MMNYVCQRGLQSLIVSYIQHCILLFKSICSSPVSYASKSPLFAVYRVT